jgi:hypothetical protein
MGKHTKSKFRKRFPDLHYKTLVLFRNPDEFNHIYIEKVNPTHHAVIWGRRKKKLKKGTNYIRLGEIYFSSVVLAYGLTVVGWLDFFTGYVYGLLMQVTMFGFITTIILAYILYFMPIRLSKGVTKC